MANWVWRGLASGIVTTKYPQRQDNIPGGWPGLPVVTGEGQCPEFCPQCREVCPAGAIDCRGAAPVIDYRRCLFCRLCVTACPAGVLKWEDDFRTARRLRPDRPSERLSRRSVYIRHVDAGACECCLWEVGALSQPHYDLHRLGFFFVTSPRHADLLLVSGPVTRNMASALDKTYQAMPQPKIVIACGGCACGASLGGSSYATPFKLEELLPVDVFIPGCPPAPLSLLHGLLLAVGRMETGSAAKDQQFKTVGS